MIPNKEVLIVHKVRNNSGKEHILCSQAVCPRLWAKRTRLQQTAKIKQINTMSRFVLCRPCESLSTRHSHTNYRYTRTVMRCSVRIAEYRKCAYFKDNTKKRTFSAPEITQASSLQCLARILHCYCVTVKQEMHGQQHPVWSDSCHRHSTPKPMGDYWEKFRSLPSTGKERRNWDEDIVVP